jgi:hypothetical protein
MPHSRDEVVAVVRNSFPESAHARVIELLDTYGVESYERERERVQLAILKLSGGSEEKMREFVAVAKRDYRDVLFWRRIRTKRDWIRSGETGTNREMFRKVWDQTAGRL